MTEVTKFVMTHAQQVKSFERSLLLDALNEYRWNRMEVARVLGLSYRSLRYRLEKLGIEHNGSGQRVLPAGFGRLWPALRKTALDVLGRTCVKCRSMEANGAKLHVDHIRPIKTHPELALDFSNLQVLCERCNLRKGAKPE